MVKIFLDGTKHAVELISWNKIIWYRVTSVQWWILYLFENEHISEELFFCMNQMWQINYVIPFDVLISILYILFLMKLTSGASNILRLFSFVVSESSPIFCMILICILPVQRINASDSFFFIFSKRSQFEWAGVLNAVACQVYLHWTLILLMKYYFLYDNIFYNCICLNIEIEETTTKILWTKNGKINN